MKRAFDIVCSFSALILLAPVILVVAIAVHWKIGAPILFKQVRPGLNSMPFTLVKFRTMRNSTDEFGQLLSDSQRLTPLGNWMRASSLDELPELWNVLKGDMSLVGPRPLLMAYLPLYTIEQARRHEVRPGITGWAQVNGRNAIDWEEKFALDVWYVDNQSLMLDLKILFKTILKVFSQDGINSSGHATMPLFSGQRKSDEL